MVINRILDYSSLYNAWKFLGGEYNPPLCERIDNFNGYIDKIFDNGITFAAIENGNILGMISFYANDIDSKTAFITQIIVSSQYQKRGIGKILLNECVKTSIEFGMTSIILEVKKNNNNAINFYERNGFSIKSKTENESYFMIKSLGVKND